MKKVFALLMSVMMAAGILSGCGSSGTPASSGSSASVASASQSTQSSDYSSMKIGVLLSGSANDGGWSQMAADAAKAVQEKYGCTVNYSESVPTTDYESTIRGYADAGYNVVVCHGSEFLDAVKAVSPEYTDVTFICTSSTSGLEPNLTGVDFGSYQFGFLVGAACGLATDTGNIGIVCASTDGTAGDWNNGVIDGAKYSKPDGKVITVCTGSWDDALKCKQAVDALAQQGCDVISQNADAAGMGAIQECDALGLMDVGAVSDQSSVGESCFISVVQDSKLGIETAIDDAVQGTLKAGFVNMDATVNVVTLTGYSGKYADKLTDEQKATLQDLWQQAHDGVDLSTLVNK